MFLTNIHKDIRSGHILDVYEKLPAVTFMTEIGNFSNVQNMSISNLNATSDNVITYCFQSL